MSVDRGVYGIGDRIYHGIHLPGRLPDALGWAGRHIDHDADCRSAVGSI